MGRALLRVADPPYSMILAVTDVDVAFAVTIDAMRSCGAATSGSTIRAIAFLAVADQRFDHAALLSNDANRVALGVGQIDVARWSERDALWSGERCRFGRATVADVARLTSPCEVMQRTRFQVYAIDRVALAQCEIQAAFAVEVECSRAIERRAGELCSIRCWLLLTSAGKGADEARLEIYDAHAVIENVADVESVLIVERDRVWAAELRLSGRATIAREACLSGAGDRRDLAGLPIDTTDDVILHLDEEDMAGLIEADFIRFVELRVGREAAVAGVALRAIARNERQLAGPLIELPYHMRGDLADVELTVGTFGDAIGLADGRLSRDLFTGDKALRSITRDSDDICGAYRCLEEARASGDGEDKRDEGRRDKLLTPHENELLK